MSKQTEGARAIPTVEDEGWDAYFAGHRRRRSWVDVTIRIKDGIPVMINVNQAFRTVKAAIAGIGEPPDNAT